MRKLRAGLLVAALATVGAPLASVSARAQDCPGNPTALGTSRLLVIDPGK
jgi:hypothetical protein